MGWPCCCTCFTRCKAADPPLLIISSLCGAIANKFMQTPHPNSRTRTCTAVSELQAAEDFKTAVLGALIRQFEPGSGGSAGGSGHGSSAAAGGVARTKQSSTRHQHTQQLLHTSGSGSLSRQASKTPAAPSSKVVVGVVWVMADSLLVPKEAASCIQCGNTQVMRRASSARQMQRAATTAAESDAALRIVCASGSARQGRQRRALSCCTCARRHLAAHPV
jgi:hypothetical protein